MEHETTWHVHGKDTLHTLGDKKLVKLQTGRLQGLDAGRMTKKQLQVATYIGGILWITNCF